VTPEFPQHFLFFPVRAPEPPAFVHGNQRWPPYPFVKEPIDRNFQAAREFLQRLDGRDRITVFHSPDIGALQPCTLLKIASGYLFLFAQGTNALAHNHARDYSRRLPVTQVVNRLRLAVLPLSAAFPSPPFCGG